MAAQGARGRKKWNGTTKRYHTDIGTKMTCGKTWSGRQRTSKQIRKHHVREDNAVNIAIVIQVSKMTYNRKRGVIIEEIEYLSISRTHRDCTREYTPESKELGRVRDRSTITVGSRFRYNNRIPRDCRLCRQCADVYC